jgi:hypothetical protein
MTAYCCLQFLNRNRWRSLVKLHCIYKGRVPKVKGGYDPSAQVKTKDMFNTSATASTENLSSASPKIPHLLRRASIEILARSQSPSLHISRSYEDVRTASSLSFHRKRCQSGSDDLDLESNSFYTPRPTPLRYSVQNSPKKTIHTQTSLLNLKFKTQPTSVQLIRDGARFVQFAVGAYGANFLKIMVSKRSINL